ncbi:hypothetical protein PMKS-002542 [Pichia membranifaciens]|uniref:RRM domain-containing protein n=1 Tax=Pichia membranifaciens TaxID=4926 RepID=A0A1Q2YI71_9ASCO|nr:hypothetical protein PMKS-002542 [Pichia membranifaciens]
MADKEAPVTEIEINLDADTPLSKKELRRIKKGKTTLEKIQKKKAKKLASAAAAAPAPAAAAEAVEKRSGEEGAAADAAAGDAAPKQPKRSDFGIWIGNLSFDTTRDELVVPNAKRAFEEYAAPAVSSSANASTEAQQPIVSKGFQEKQDRPAKRVHHSSARPEGRVTSSVALANAQRQSAAVVKSTGKKITF